MFDQSEQFRTALMSTRGITLVHSSGEKSPYKTILTEQEFCLTFAFCGILLLLFVAFHFSFLRYFILVFCAILFWFFAMRATELILGMRNASRQLVGRASDGIIPLSKRLS